MYGLVNRAIEQLVVASRGPQAWQRVRAIANIQDDGFVAMCPYDDSLTFALVDAASQELQISQAQVLEAFGEYWILYTAEEGYGELLQAGGDNLREFMLNLNDMHGRVENIFPQMRLPIFRVVGESLDHYEVHYESERAGLSPMVVGLIKGLAKRFGQAVSVTQTHSRAQGDTQDIFAVAHLESPRSSA